MTSRPGSLRGATRPRVEVAPATPVAYSLGPEAVELARRAGLGLDPWQVDGVDLMLSVRPDGLWVCAEYGEICSRQNGKTTGLFAPRALAGMFLLNEKTILWSAHEYKTAMESFRQFKTMLLRLGTETRPNLIRVDGSLVKVNNTNGEEEFERLDTNQRVKFIARSKGSGRGFTAETHLIDEAFAYTRAQQDAVTPTMLAVPNPQFAYASSPPLDGASGEVLFALRERALAGGDEALGWRDWGLEGDLDHLDEIDLEDRALWAATNPAGGLRLTERNILHCLQTMGAVGFAREVLGLWPVQIGTGGGVIDPEVFDALADPDSQITGPVVFAIEVNKERTSGAICVAGRRPDGIPHGEVVDHRPGRGTGWMIKRATELDAEHHPLVWMLYPGGPAGALLTDLQDAGIEPELVAAREMAQACGALYDAVTAPSQDRFRHLGQASLTIALRSALKRDVGDGLWTWDRRGATDISPLNGVTLAVHGLAVHGGGDPLDNIW